MGLNSLVLPVTLEVYAQNLFYIVGRPQEIALHDSNLENNFENLTRNVCHISLK